MERFSPEQIQEYYDAFVMFDADGSGDILVSELRDMLKTVGMNPTDDILEIMTIVIDEVNNYKRIPPYCGACTYIRNPKKNKITENR